QNLGVYDYGDAGGKALAGIGPKAGGYDENWGFGAISARFASGQSSLGFQVRDADGGPAFLSLYRADGSLIQTVTIAALDSSFYAFARSGGAADIAGFSLTTRDSYYGIAIDELKFAAAAAPVPEPASALLFAGGLAALLARRSRKT
ncbi:PEP-CTERM sorting domain-containing protein, partial [Pelomonas sp. KK5]|uniref:PEP-CTERM sorting domain-containing protein n=1 Tax=Pelomonas sp. KK5 TaxID=1855730 RepID=UPI001180F612